MYIVLFLLLLLTVVIYSCFINNNNNNNNNKYKLAIMAIFKNEEDYIEEWLEHHINQGIGHFYLYCNDPYIDKYKIFENYKDKITLINWVDKINNGVKTIQKQAYTHCVQTYYNEFQYIMMLDIDEFIININKNNKVIDYINSLDDNTEALKVQRFNFDSNGHKTKPKGKVMDNYKNKEEICSSYKTIANIDYIDKNLFFYGVHDFNLINKGKIYNKYLNYYATGFPNSCTKESINEIPLIINHYYSKSEDEDKLRKELWKSGGVNPINYRK